MVTLELIGHSTPARNVKLRQIMPPTGIIWKPRLPRRVKCLFIFQVYHSFKNLCGSESFFSFPARLGNRAYRVVGVKKREIYLQI